MKKLLSFLLLAIPFAIFGQNTVLNLGGNTLGVLYSKQVFTNTSDFTVTGATTSIVGNAIRLTGGTSDFTKFLTLNGFTSMDENVEYEVIFTVQSAATSSTYGIATGKKSINTGYPNSLSGQCSMVSGGGAIYLNQGNFTTISTTNDATLGTFAAGNSIKVRWRQIKNVITFSVLNMTTNYFNSATYKDELFSTGIGITPYLPNASNFCIWLVGSGTIDITSVKLTSYTPVKQKLVCIGDSKTQGYSGSNINNRFGSLLGAIVYAGGGDKTAEMLACAPYLATMINSNTTVIMNIGRNDISVSVPAATYQANYIAIVNAITATGARVIHLLPIPDNAINQSALTTWIISQYGIQNCVNPAVRFTTASNTAIDGVHPNASGHIILADLINIQLQ